MLALPIAVRAALALALLALLAPLARPARAQGGQAPDGRPGFGRETTQKELRRLFLSRDEEDGRHVAELRALAQEVRAQLAALGARYRERGWLVLAADASPAANDPVADALALHAALREACAEPEERLALDEGRGLLWARLLCDVRTRLRAEVGAGVERELADLEGGLALFAASFDGWAEVDELDASRIGPRVDLAAATLRALRLDLEALRADEPPDEEALAALSAGALGEAGAAGATRSRVLARLDARVASMRAMLATTRLAPRLSPLRAWRAEALAECRRRAPEVLRLLPEAASGADPGRDVTGLSKSERHARAAQLAGEALAHDPLDAELCYWAGVAEDFAWGALRSRRWFDRFLALRGIRAHDQRTYELDALDPLERDALERMSARNPPPLPPFPPR